MEWKTNGKISTASGKHLIREGYTIGDPKPSDECSIEYLKRQGIVGFYSIRKVTSVPTENVVIG